MEIEDTPFERELRKSMEAIEVIHKSDVAMLFKLSALNRISEFVFTVKDKLMEEEWGESVAFGGIEEAPDDLAG